MEAQGEELQVTWAQLCQMNRAGSTDFSEVSFKSLKPVLHKQRRDFALLSHQLLRPWSGTGAATNRPERVA